MGTTALFEGTDSNHNLSLWITDGTSAGTSEVAAPGAFPGGLFSGVSPDLTVLGSKVLFAGEDTNGLKHSG